MELPFELKRSADFDAVGFGTNAVDHLIRVAEYPEHNSKVRLTGYTQAAGGEIASAMAGLQRLGMTTAYAGRFGGDQAGKIGIASLADEGVDVTACEVVADAQTQMAFILVDERSGERTIIWDRDRRLAYAAADAPVEIAARGKILHIAPHDVEACIGMARAAKASGAIVTIDIDNVFDGIDVLLPLVDVCIAASDVAQRLAGISGLCPALAEISARYGCSIVGVTQGEKGSAFYCGGTYFESRGFAVPGGCVDTTGAGDAFRAGFLYGMLTHATVEDCSILGNAVAALKCRAVGARAGLPDKNDLNNFLNKC